MTIVLKHQASVHNLQRSVDLKMASPHDEWVNYEQTSQKRRELVNVRMFTHIWLFTHVCESITHRTMLSIVECTYYNMYVESLLSASRSHLTHMHTQNAACRI